MKTPDEMGHASERRICDGKDHQVFRENEEARDRGIDTQRKSDTQENQTSKGLLLYDRNAGTSTESGLDLEFKAHDK